MKLKAKVIKISTGGSLISILNNEDAKLMDLHALDRIKIKKGRKTETVVLDIADSKRVVAKGRLGVFEEVADSLNLKNGDEIRIMPARKPLSIGFIRKKLDGERLNKKEIEQIVWDIVHNKLSSIELTYFVAAGYTKTLTAKETIMLTNAMCHEGDILHLNKYPVIDKHCVGGVAGNRTTMIIVPIVAAAGLTIPKTSSRSITSPAGTADTMEVLAEVCIPIKKMKRVVEKTGGCMVWGGSLNLAPADDKIIHVEKPLAIDAKSQLLASIMAKKLSVSSTHILVDIPAGGGSKIPSYKKAAQLKKDFESIGKALKKHMKVIITDGRQPIGNGIGPSLEARDVLWVLKNDALAPKDLREKSIRMAGLILEMGGKAKKGMGKRIAKELLETGLAYDKMTEIIKAQGEKQTNPNRIRLGKYQADIKAGKSGRVKQVDNKAISKIARVLGAPDSKGSGIYIYKHMGDKVRKGEPLFRMYSESRHRIKYANDIIKAIGGFLIK